VRNMRFRGPVLISLLWAMLISPHAGRADESKAKVYVILWFDTEDYILPASDNAVLRVARFLLREGIRAVFKIVGERARTFEQRGRDDIISALKQHEIGFHSNWHSVQPTPAMYLSNLGWDEGTAEFDRREKAGFDDVKRIFGIAPTCYGQPGSSWAPQSFGAMKKWGMGVYLDAGNHIRLGDRPHYYCGILTLYRLEHTLRANLDSLQGLKSAEDRFLDAKKKLLAEGGGIISIYYHPCEFVHKEFWDGANFKYGANPPREKWKQPAIKTPEESKIAYEVFENYIRFIKRFPEVRFITATQAARLYHDRARNRQFTPREIKSIAAAVKKDVTFQRHGRYALAASEVFVLLNEYVAARSAGRNPGDVILKDTPLGPTQPTARLAEPVTTDWSQFQRTAMDVRGFLIKHGRIPSTVWLGSIGVPPESYLQALAQVTLNYLANQPPPENVTVPPARLTAADDVAEDGQNLWGWVIFPRGFRAPRMMELAKRQAWTLKPAILDAQVRLWENALQR
jgi:hypothetical protein